MMSILLYGREKKLRTFWIRNNDSLYIGKKTESQEHFNKAVIFRKNKNIH